MKNVLAWHFLLVFFFSNKYPGPIKRPVKQAPTQNFCF